VDISYLDFDEAIWEKLLAPLREGDRALVERIREALPIAADVSRSDVFLFLPGEDEFCVALHARSHAMATLFPNRQAGRCLSAEDRPWLWQSIARGHYTHRVTKDLRDALGQVQQQIWPVLGESGQVIAAIGVYTNAVELERHKRRAVSFQLALNHFFKSLARGELRGCTDLPPFTDHSGIVFIDGLGRYRYLSGIAANIYRHLGYLDDLRMRTLEEVAAGDQELVHRAWEARRCIFEESVVRNRILQRSVIPLFGRSDHLTFWERRRWASRVRDRYGALLLVNDVTEERETEAEIKIKTAMIKEVHHRLKNNLQLLISIMRMQARRAQSDEARELLLEAMNRLKSMAVIQESLSYGESEALNLTDVLTQIASQTQMSLVAPHRRIRIRFAHADDIQLPTNRVTACALVFNELLINAVKHGFGEQESGEIRIELHDRGEDIELVMEDTGRGLPEDFSPDKSTSIGLDIIRTLVQDDLKGTIEFSTLPQGGTRAKLLFPKQAPGGS
jgi:two-component sensor histidine kinase